MRRLGDEGSYFGEQSFGPLTTTTTTSVVAPPATTEQRLKDRRRRHRRDLVAQERRSKRLMEELHERRDASIKSFEGAVAPFRGEDINLSLTATVVAFEFLFAPVKNSDRNRLTLTSCGTNSSAETHAKWKP